MLFFTVHTYTHTHTHNIYTYIRSTHPTRETMTQVSALLMRPIFARSRGCAKKMQLKQK